MFVSREWIQSIWGLHSDFTLSCSPENGYFPTPHFTVALKIAVSHFTFSCRPERSSFPIFTFLWTSDDCIPTSLWPWKCLFSHFMFSTELQESYSLTSCFHVGLKAAVFSLFCAAFSPPTFHWAWNWLFLHFTLFLGPEWGHLLVFHFPLILTMAIFSQFLVPHLYGSGCSLSPALSVFVACTGCVSYGCRI